MTDETESPKNSHDKRIGMAYIAGIIAARNDVPNPTTGNPYGRYTEEWVAYHSGWRDEMVRRQRQSPRP